MLDALPWRALLKAGASAKARAALTAVPAAGAEPPAPPPPPAYVLARLDRIAPPGAGAAEAEGRAKALAYLALLLHLNAAPFVIDDAWLDAHCAAAAVASHVVARFTEHDAGAAGAGGAGGAGGGKARYPRSQRVRDLLIATVIVVALSLEDYSLEFAELATALRMEAPKLVRRLGEVGCKIARSGGPSRAVLMGDGAAGKTLAACLPDTRTRAKAKKNR